MVLSKSAGQGAEATNIAACRSIASTLTGFVVCTVMEQSVVETVQGVQNPIILDDQKCMALVAYTIKHE